MCYCVIYIYVHILHMYKAIVNCFISVDIIRNFIHYVYDKKILTLLVDIEVLLEILVRKS